MNASQTYPCTLYLNSRFCENLHFIETLLSIKLHSQITVCGHMLFGINWRLAIFVAFVVNLLSEKFSSLKFYCENMPCGNWRAGYV